MSKTIIPEMVRERLEAAYYTLDIPTEVERHTSTRLHSVTRGKQYGGACPYPDCIVDTDGFMVWPVLTPRGKHYHCRGCKRSGDILKLIQDIRGLGFSDACKELGIPNPYLDDDSASILQNSQVRRRVQKAEQWQLDELAYLNNVYPRAKLALQRDRARAYLSERAIPFDLAEAQGLGYIPALSEVSHPTPELERFRRWCNRIIFPILTPKGEIGYCGRSLFLWEPGMDEDEHKRRIDAYNLQMKEQHGNKAIWHQMPRWKYTYQQGFFNWQAVKEFDTLVFVEGAFDALACMASGIMNVIPIGTTGLDANILPINVCSAIMGLDIDGPGRKAAKQLATSLRRKGIDVEVCISGDGKDWSAAYRLHGAKGLAPLVGAIDNGLVCGRCGISNSLSSETFQDHDGKLLCSHCISSSLVEESKNFLVDLVTDEGLCSTCLDLDPPRETPTSYDLGDFMYCEEHHPQRQALIAFTGALIAHCPDLQVREVYHVSQRAEVERRILEEHREREMDEARRLQDEIKTRIRQANEARRRIATMRHASNSQAQCTLI
jgi:hypothetical protein